MFPPRGPSSDFEYPRGPLKRYHDDGTPAQSTDDGSLMGDVSYSSEHRSKRLHALPFRTSPTARKWNPAATMAIGMPQPPSAMTPPGSFSETATSFQAHGSSGFGEHSRTAIALDNDAMADLDMDMSLDCEPGQADLMPPSQPDNGFSDRMPTPMQPTFAAQVRGSNWNGANANAGYAGSPSMPSFMQKPDAMDETSASSPNSRHYANQGNERSVPRPLEHPAVMGDWGMIQNRSLPSPISEDGGDSGSDNHHHHEYDHDHVHDHDHDSAFSTPRRPGAIASSPLHTPLVGAASSPVRATMDGSDPAATPSPKKGHSRSRHTIIAWTNQPGMKKSFSIGYRADCEKCRNRVPGHFNHIVVS